jgi:TolB-like protein
VQGLRVVAHSSSFSFKGRDIDARDIGRQLNVGLILEGSVRKSGDRLRIAVQLIDANDGYHVWSDTDRQLLNVFAIQEISRCSVRMILRHDVHAPLVNSGTCNMAA